MKNIELKNIGKALLIISLIFTFIVWGIYCAVSLPYQDATIEMIKNQEEEIKEYLFLVKVGIGGIIFSILILNSNKLWNKIKK